MRINTNLALAACLLTAGVFPAYEAKAQDNGYTEQGEVAPDPNLDTDIDSNIETDTGTSESTQSDSASPTTRSPAGVEPSPGSSTGAEVSGAAPPTSSGQPAGRTEAEAETQESGYGVGITNFALRPSVGAIFFNGNERFAGGVLMDFNFLSTPWAKIGPAIGTLYSSTATGDFFSGVSTSNSDYILQFPANLKATVSPDSGHRLNLGIHGGANIIRSTASTAVGTGANVDGRFGGTGNSLNLSGSPEEGASWDVHPNVGADLDYALATNFDITLRPDVTFLSDFEMVTATLALAVKL